MLAKKRNKKLGRMSESDLKEASQKNVISDSDIIKTKEELIMKFTNSIKDSQNETKEKLTEEQIEELIKTEVSIFCRKYGIDVNNKTIFSFAKLKGLDSKWQDMLLRNPYVLMKMENVGFVRADSIAMRLGFPHDHKYRILAFVGQSLEDLSKGSTIINLGTTMVYMGKHLNIKDNNRIVDVVLNQADDTYKLLDSNHKVTTDMTQARYLTKTVWYETERDFYKLCLASSRLKPLEVTDKIIQSVVDKLPFKLNKGQTEGINSFYKTGLCVLTGRSGSGKTTMTKAIIGVLRKMRYTYTVLTPTGIASKVFTSQTGSKSKTIHRHYFSGQKIESDYLILDECSMHSIDHIRMLLKMIDMEQPPRILMIGDCHQLTPISVGDPFYSIIRLMNCGRLVENIIDLTEIMRASSELYIPYLCNQFIDGNYYNSSVENEEDLKGVTFEPLKENLCKQILDVIQRNNFNFDNTLILIPQNIGDMGNHVVNNYIDEIVAKGKVLYQDKFKVFRRGSYCMNIKNNSELDIYNGERIILLDKIGDRFICEKIDDKTIVEYEENLFKETVQLSYSLTIHKTQGVTLDNIIFVASNKFYHMNTRNLFYTGISRASKHVVILFDRGAMSIASKKKVIDSRITFLGQLSKI